MTQSTAPIAGALTQRSRRCGPKVRTGCITCKIRRVKCDEKAPHCTRCTSTGRKCDGYAPVQHRRLHAISEIVHLARNPLQNPMATEALCYWSAPRLAQVFGQETFWNHTLPHIAVMEPAIQYALLALRSTHEGYGSQLQTKDNGLALQAYNRAIQHLLRNYSQAQSSDVHVVLVVCALFACIEFSRGNAKLGITHVRNGIKILRQHGFSDDDLLDPSLGGRPEKSHLEEIAAFFARLRFQSLVYDITMLPDNITSKAFFEKFPTPTPTFKTLLDARQAAFEILFRCLVFIYAGQAVRFSGSVTDTMEAQHACLCAHLAHWHDAFDALSSHQAHSWDTNHMLLANTTKIQALGVWIWTATCLAPEQCAFDTFMPQFEAIITLAEQTVHALVPSFRVDMGIICILHLAGVKCRDARLRRRMLRVLAMRRWREGLYDSWNSYRIVHREMTVEERNLDLLRDPSLLPEEKDRIQGSSLLGFMHKDDGVTFIRLDLVSLPDGLDSPFRFWHEFIEVEGELPPYLDLD